MNKNDFVSFTSALDNACMDIGKDPMTQERRQSLFKRYMGFDIVTMQNAIFSASGDDQVRFSGISPAILNKHLGVKALVDLEWGDVLAHAKNKNSPMGVLASLHIGSFELREKSDLDNMVAAKSFLLDLPNIAADLSRGEISDHALTIMHKNSVYPESMPFMPGLALPHAHKLLVNRTNEVMLLDSYKAHNSEGCNAGEVLSIECSEGGEERVAKEISKLSAITAKASINKRLEGVVQPKIDYSASEAEQILIDDTRGK